MLFALRHDWATPGVAYSSILLSIFEYCAELYNGRELLFKLDLRSTPSVKFTCCVLWPHFLTIDLILYIIPRHLASSGCTRDTSLNCILDVQGIHVLIVRHVWIILIGLTLRFPRLHQAASVFQYLWSQFFASIIATESGKGKVKCEIYDIIYDKCIYNTHSTYICTYIDNNTLNINYSRIATFLLLLALHYHKTLKIDSSISSVAKCFKT